MEPIKLDPQLEAVYKKCLEFRGKKNLTLKDSRFLRKTFTDFGGREREFSFRYYQVQAVLHLILMNRFVLGDDCGLGKCKTLDSLVLTDRGLVELGKLAPEGVTLEPDTFYALDQPTQVWTGWKWASIKRFYYNGNQTIVRLKTNSGRETTGTFVHPLLTYTEGVESFEPMGSLQIGDVLCVESRTQQELFNGVQREFRKEKVVAIQHEEALVADLEIDDDDHSFVADGFVNHNTLETIGALTYVWAKNPNQKVLILTTKSAAPQWADEFKRFTKGINVILCRGKPRFREKARRAFQKITGPTICIMGYRTAVQDFTQMQDWKDHLLVADECLDYFTPIKLADGTTELIGKIVCGEMPLEVLSENPETHEIEAKKIIAWHRVPLQGQGNRRQLLKLSFRFSKSIRVTKNHEIFRPGGGKTPAVQLKKDHEVLHLCENTPTEIQKQVILGGLLGDSSISFPKRSLWGIVSVQSAKRGAYLRFKRDILAPLGVSRIDESLAGYQPKVGSKIPVERFRLNGNAAVTSLLVEGRVWRDGKKRVTKDWLDHVGPLGLAIWYADDGSLGRHICADGRVTYKITLNSQGFTRDEQELLAGWLNWKWGIKAEIKTTKPRSDRKVGYRECYSYLYLPDVEAKKFLDILPGSFPSVEYKFPGKKPFTYLEEGIKPTVSLVTDWVASTEKFVHKNPNVKYVYDIAVEDNRNYFAGKGLKVSNCTAFKNPRTQVAQVCKHLSLNANRAWGLSATIIKNNLTEAYGIYQVIVPGLFSSMNHFMKHFCIVEYQRIPKSNRKIPIIVGHSDWQIERFRELIDPFFLGRPKHAVAPELPTLTIRQIKVGLYPEQVEKYLEALEGLLEVLTEDGMEEKEVSKLTAVTYCQEIVNHLGLIGHEGDSTKLDALVEMLTEGDLAGQKVIVFSRFRKMVDLAIPVLQNAGVKCTRVTGSENDHQRREAMIRFQTEGSDTNVIFITMAGGDAINLQAAKAIIFFDSPWSAGDYLQIIGRMIRIGSDHDKVYAFHLVTEADKIPDKATVDGRVQQVLSKKMTLIEAVLGERIKGGKEKAVDYRLDSNVTELFELLKNDAKRTL